jgi:hypothetical protein
MHGQQTRGLFDRKPTIRTGLHMKVGDPGVFFVEEVQVSGESWAWLS